ncbi:MAG: ferrous iron transport protein B [Oscillospiraceae bacterium]|nr:ferrous iron transport protein B [Oscillospiraceae bacterium]
MTIGFIGNPNSGKTTLFNAYTGANLKVANWPGVTVEKKEGALKYHGRIFKLVDLPGAYSLSSYTLEETVAENYILSGEVDVLINVVDASSLERNLYLTLQLLELGKPLVIALNMMDIVEKRGMEIDLHRLHDILGVPVVPVSALKRRGLDSLIHAAAHHRDETGAKNNKNNNNFEFARKIKPEAKTEFSEFSEFEEKYSVIEAIVGEVLVNREKANLITNKADAILTNKFSGLPAFLLIMALVFFLTFLIGDKIKDYIEIIFENFSEFADEALVNLGINEIVHSLITDGIIAGVGAVLSFLPNIFILFIMLAVLEDSGYMSRVAYVMNGIMTKIGLSGKAFVPMLLGFGCSVPAVMATRSLGSSKDRLRTIIVIPFMSCSAKLPIYILFSGMFFPGYSALAAYSMYLIGFILGIFSAFIFNKIDNRYSIRKHNEENNSLIIELPGYKTPGFRTVFIYVWEKIKDYILRAGTVIFAASVIIWGVMHLGFSGYTNNIAESFGAVLGEKLAVILSPAGLGFWQAGVALIAGFAAKEIVAASFAILFGVANVTSDSGMSMLSAELSAIGFGSLNAYCLMLFSLLYPPCAAALAVIRRESGSWGKLGAVIIFQVGVAWVVSFAVYQIFSLFL